MRVYRSLTSIALCLALLLCLVSCGSTASGGPNRAQTPNLLVQNASPTTSGLMLYVYDGKKVTCSALFQANIERDVLDKISAVKCKEVKDWSPKKITLPVYGIEISRTDGTSLQAAWSNGYWIAQDGAVYSFNFDFARLKRDYAWRPLGEFDSAATLPCSRLLTQYKNEWYSKLLTPAKELTPPENITMTAEAWDKNTVTVRLANNRQVDWTYGEAYSIQVLLNAVWYDVPPLPGNWAFPSIAYNLQSRAEHIQQYDLTQYGDLPPGTYRFVVEGLSVETTIRN